MLKSTLTGFLSRSWTAIAAGLLLASGPLPSHAAATVDVNTYVPAAALASGYESYLRIINTGASPTPVTVAVIDAATGLAGPPHQLIASIPSQGSQTFSAQQVEAALGTTLAASDRPRIRVSAANSTLSAQSFLLQPGGVFNEVSGVQSGAAVPVRTYVPAAAAPSGYVSYLRVINTGAATTAVTVARIDPVTGQIGAAGLLNPSLAPGASATYTAGEVESALGFSIAAGERPRIQVAAASSTLDVQSFLIQPGGAFTEVSTGQGGSTVDVRSYVPAATPGYTTFLRIINNSATVTPVIATLVDGATGTPGASGTIIPSLAGFAATTLTSSQVEAAMGAAIPAADRPRIRISSPVAADLRVQSFLLQPNGAFNEMSNASSGSSLVVRTYIPAADAGSGYTSYLRMINTGATPTPVTVALVDPDSGAVGNAGTLTLSLAAGAARTFTSSEIEAALGAPIAAGNRPRILVSANTTLEVQSFLTQPGGAFTEVSGGQASTGTPTPLVTQNLLISEVSTAYYASDVAWLEVYNPNTFAVSLSDYTLRSSSIAGTSGASYSLAPMSFSLPAVNVPANGYLVIAGNAYSNLLNNSQIVYVNNGVNLPFWSADGSVELVTAGQTADFVRFGNSAAAPTTASQWSGPNVAALPSGPNEHGKSIVRLASGGMAKTNTAADWTLVNFATPAGPNDVAAGVVDSDNDGIPDSAKAPGGTYGGLDLYAMGARRGRRDAFIEIDYMTSATDAALTPRQEALQKVTDAFAAKGIALHLDVGNLYSAAFNPALFNLGGGNAVPFATCLDNITAFSGTTTVGCTSFYTYKSANFDVRRKLVFHYALFGNSQKADGSCGSSGVAEVVGNNLAVTMGNCGLTFAATATASGRNLLINGQAATLMHEFGHNLGLQHGGNEPNNYKPNYLSIMNYLYSLKGLSPVPDGVTAPDRYYSQYNLKGKTTCTLDNSICSSTFIMDYSNGASIALDENNLQESLNIGRGSSGGAYADWNNDGVLTSTAVSRNIHAADTSYGLSVLKDYNDWANLNFPFARGYAGSNAGPSLFESAPKQRVNPMNERPDKVIVEDPLPEHLKQSLRELRNDNR